MWKEIWGIRIRTDKKEKKTYNNLKMENKICLKKEYACQSTDD